MDKILPIKQHFPLPSCGNPKRPEKWSCKCGQLHVMKWTQTLISNIMRNHKILAIVSMPSWHISVMLSVGAKYWCWIPMPLSWHDRQIPSEHHRAWGWTEHAMQMNFGVELTAHELWCKWKLRYWWTLWNRNPQCAINRLLTYSEALRPLQLLYYPVFT